jgi:hypothetical protein
MLAKPCAEEAAMEIDWREFDAYLQQHLRDVAAGYVMPLSPATIRERSQGDWSGGLNASEMFRDNPATERAKKALEKWRTSGGTTLGGGW